MGWQWHPNTKKERKKERKKEIGVAFAFFRVTTFFCSSKNFCFIFVGWKN